MGIIREINFVKQDSQDLTKRWFTDDEYWDLFVWINKADEIVHFQLCYSRETNEHALTWKVKKGFYHAGVSTRRDDKGYRGSLMGSPILVPDGYFNKNPILNKFIQDGRKMDPQIYNFIISKINEYGI